jgi:hypothetical protein
MRCRKPVRAVAVDGQVMRALEPQLEWVKAEVVRLRDEQTHRQEALEQEMADYTATRAQRAERLATNLSSTTSFGGPLQMTSAGAPLAFDSPTASKPMAFHLHWRALFLLKYGRGGEREKGGGGGRGRERVRGREGRRQGGREGGGEAEDEGRKRRRLGRPSKGGRVCG